DIHDAASIDGAGSFRTMFQITIPLVLPILLVAVLFGFVFAFTDMIVVWVLTRGGPYDMTQVLASLAFFKGIDGGDLAGASAIALLLLAVPAGYALARLSGTFGEQLGIGIFLTYLVPPTILFIPLAKVVSTLHLQDNLWALVLTYPSFTIPFCTWLMMGFFKAIPKDIEEAAMVDGMSRLGAFVRVILPMSVAGLLTVVIFSFTLVMQEFVYGLTFINSGRNFTVSVGVPSFLVRGDVYFWGSLMGACFI